VVPAQITIYDSMGVSHVATVDFTNKGGGTWDYGISLPDTLTGTSSTATAGSPAVTTTTQSYTFSKSGSTDGTVNPATDLTITGTATGGGTATITAPTVTAGETVGAYATALNSALTAAGITGVMVYGQRQHPEHCGNHGVQHPRAIGCRIR
jgi:hypothetical protein